MSPALLRDQYSIMMIRTRMYLYGVVKWGFTLETNNIKYSYIRITGARHPFFYHLALHDIMMLY